MVGYILRDSRDTVRTLTERRLALELPTLGSVCTWPQTDQLQGLEEVIYLNFLGFPFLICDMDKALPFLKGSRKD